MAVQTRANLIIDVNTRFPDNTLELIEPIDDRTTKIDIIDSMIHRIDDVGLLNIRDWDSGRDYDQSEGAFDSISAGINRVFRAKNNVLSGGTNPAADATNWELVQHTFANGINDTATAGVVGLGGNLTVNTSVPLNSFSLELGNVRQSGVGGFAIGLGTTAPTDTGSVTIGENAATTSGTINAEYISIGHETNSGIQNIGTSSITIGNNSDGIGTNSICIGLNSEAQSEENIVIGSDSGNTTGTVGVNNIIIGENAGSGTANIGANCILIGQNTIVSSNNGSTAISINAQATGFAALAMQLDSIASGAQALAIGRSAQATNTNSIAHGYLCQSTGLESLAMGFDSDATNTRAIALGRLSKSAGASGISIGDAAEAPSTSVVSIGTSAGNTSGTVGNFAVSIGSLANEGTSNIGAASVCIGQASETTAANSTAIGQLLSATAAGAIIAGYGVGATIPINSTADSVGFGWNETTPSVLFAKTADSFISNNGALVLGANSATNSSTSLDLQSTTRAPIMPRMSTTERNALTAVNGMIIYNTTDNQMQGYINGSWTAM